MSPEGIYHETFSHVNFVVKNLNPNNKYGELEDDEYGDTWKVYRVGYLQKWLRMSFYRNPNRLYFDYDPKINFPTTKQMKSMKDMCIENQWELVDATNRQTIDLLENLRSFKKTA